LFQNDGKTQVWRLSKEKYDVGCVVPTVSHGGGGGVMVWVVLHGNLWGLCSELKEQLTVRHIEYTFNTIYSRT